MSASSGRTVALRGRIFHASRNRDRLGAVTRWIWTRLALAHPVRVRDQLSHHISRIYDRARRLARDPRGRASRDRQPVYRRLFDFWLKVFAVSFGMGVVSGIVMAFQFGTNWGVLSRGPDRSRDPCSVTRASPRSCSKRPFSASSCSAESACPRDLPLLLLHDRLGHDVLGVLDHGQQQLDAGSGGLRDGRRTLPADWWTILTSWSSGALVAHAARRRF